MVKVSTLDNKFGCPNPDITKAVEELGIDVDEVLFSEVGLDSRDESSFDYLMRGPKHEGAYEDFKGLHDSETHCPNDASSDNNENDEQEDGSDDDDDGDDNDDDDNENDGGTNKCDVHIQSQRPLTPFTGEANFDNAMQDEDHGS